MTRIADGLKLGAPILALVLAGFALAWLFVDPAPPSTITLATGEPGGAYASFGEAYRDVLADYEIELQLRETVGTAENLALLRAGEVEVGFVQGGVATADDAARLQSLGSLYYEPLWIFHRSSVSFTKLSELAGLRLSAGPEGSGTRAVALQLLEANGITTRPLGLSGRQAARALRAGELDVVFLVASPRSDAVRELLREQERGAVDLFSVARADAYLRTHRFLSKLELPQGVIDYAADIPSTDTTLLSPAANLVIDPAVHPVLVDLLLLAAARIHGPGGVFEDPESFPSPRYRDLPLNADAARYYEYGPSFLQRYLPFWVATQLDRLKVMLIPLVALMIPLVRIFPPVYRWRVRSRIYRWYKELRAIDPSSRHDLGVDRALAEVARIEEEVAHVNAPDSYAEELFSLRLHIDFVRNRLLELRGGEERKASAQRASG